jgi:hypothetical protein
MYLKRVRHRDGYHHVIRESYRDEGFWRHRDLVDLGTDPADYIEYPGGNGFYFKWELEEALETQGVSYSNEDLEELFFPFLDPHIRRIIENFRRHSADHSPWNACSPQELLHRQQVLHSLDKRRLHYLRCGRIDIGNLDGRPWKFLNVLLEKSRDEIEHTIEMMERELRPQEIRSYIFTSFHLQTYFPHHPMRNRPVALDPEKVDRCFLQEVCRLNRNVQFFRGVDHHDSETLHPYLTKYVILYFDHEFGQSPLGEVFREFIWHRQFRRPSASKPALKTQEACQCLGITREEFDKMSSKDLVRCYRRQAKEMHPDRGGGHDAFVRLTDAYECLLMKKR